MIVLVAVKLIVLAFIAFTLSGACIGTGILFAGYCTALAKNPEEADSLFGATLMGFALIETFVFMSIALGCLIFFI